MGGPISGREAMIAAMDPQLDPRSWRFVLVTPDNAPQLLGAAIGTFREDEGVTAIVPVAVADEAGLAGPDFRRIVLRVQSNLKGVGLTAAVASTLADAGIACNVVAAYHHDHVFVPVGRADQALTILQSLQASYKN